MQQVVYPDEMKIKDALQVYFSKYHFADGGYNDTFFKIKIGPIFIPVPNIAARVKAVKLHDVHHLLTEYTALWKGEIEIGAWEIASGCGNSLVAWVLNFGSFSLGLFIYPKTMFRAFMMGRHVKTNLYHGTNYDDALLESTVGKLRRDFEIGSVRPDTFKDLLSFVFWVLLVLVEMAFVGSLLYLILRTFISL